MSTQDFGAAFLTTKLEKNMKYYCEIYTKYVDDQNVERHQIRNHFLIEAATEFNAKHAGCNVAFYLSESHRDAGNEETHFIVSVIPWSTYEKNMADAGSELVSIATKFLKLWNG